MKAFLTCQRLLQASTGMSSQRWQVGKGMGSIAVDAVIKVFAS
jgi:hypothetical protein